ncbi:unnamed protein product [Parascedosporium putredinis]|uniref:Uncharacterized protein n=1 Tax=Parascedosporium putredinis TaxID=1442378 RepID=A0A9P1GW09_9PEZI|nr:unnamed protein product [Parascedosporium putredinis]CAI7988419.1 unnamed protein product [Parascedosporium putredinis]
MTANLLKDVMTASNAVTIKPVLEDGRPIAGGPMTIEATYCDFVPQHPIDEAPPARRVSEERRDARDAAYVGADVDG